jgi:hypothetical protein
MVPSSQVVAWSKSFVHRPGEMHVIGQHDDDEMSMQTGILRHKCPDDWIAAQWLFGSLAWLPQSTQIWGSGSGNRRHIGLFTHRGNLGPLKTGILRELESAGVGEVAAIASKTPTTSNSPLGSNDDQTGAQCWNRLQLPASLSSQGRADSYSKHGVDTIIPNRGNK